MNKLVILISLAVLLSGCSTFYGAIDTGGDSTFENSTLKIEKQISPLQVKISITNKSSKDMEILWDKCRYIDTSGNPFEIIHSGVNFKEDGTIENPPTIIKPGEIHNDFITPVAALKNIELLHSHKTEMWATHYQTTEQIYIVGGNMDYTNQDELTGLIGKEYKIVITIQLESAESTYEIPGEITEIIDFLE